MGRVTSEEIQEVMDIDSSVTDLSPFITAGNLLVTSALGGEGLSDELLKEIERYVVCHFVALRDPRVQDEKVGDFWVKYQGKTGMRFDATYYGQQATLLDPTGKLANRGKQKATIGMIDYSTDQ